MFNTKYEHTEYILYRHEMLIPPCDYIGNYPAMNRKFLEHLESWMDQESFFQRSRTRRRKLSPRVATSLKRLDFKSRTCLAKPAKN